jgi:hypothetical protein
VAIGAIAWIAVFTICGSLIQPTVVVSADPAAIDDALDLWAIKGRLLITGLVALFIVGFFAQALVHRRWPRLIGQRQRRPDPYRREGIAGIVAAVVVLSSFDDQSWNAVVFDRLVDGRYMGLVVPAGFAAQYVATMAIGALACIFALAVLGHAHEPDPSPEVPREHRTAAQG